MLHLIVITVTLVLPLLLLLLYKHTSSPLFDTKIVVGKTTCSYRICKSVTKFLARTIKDAMLY